jgi:hypothetical protein
MNVIDLSVWRHQRERSNPAEGAEPGDDRSVSRLEQAIQRLHGVVSLALDGRGHLEPRVETEILAIMGELTVGLVERAATRAERLVDRLAAAGKGGGAR